MQHLNHLSKSQQESVLSLIKAAHDFDGTPAIAEHVLLHLRHGGDKSDSHLVIEENKEVIAYAHLDTTDLIAGPSVEAVVHPQHRGKGLGSLILKEAIKIYGDMTTLVELEQLMFISDGFVQSWDLSLRQLLAQCVMLATAFQYKTIKQQLILINTTCNT